MELNKQKKNKLTNLETSAVPYRPYVNMIFCTNILYDILYLRPGLTTFTSYIEREQDSDRDITAGIQNFSQISTDTECESLKRNPKRRFSEALNAFPNPRIQTLVVDTFIYINICILLLCTKKSII